MTSSLQGNCPQSGAYNFYPTITTSNSFNTYVSNQIWAPNPGTKSTLTSFSPANWNVSIDAVPQGYTGVQGSPITQQQLDDWCPAINYWYVGTHICPNGGPMTDTPISVLSGLTSTYSESQPRTNTVSWAMWDIWTNNNGGHPNENMIVIDNNHRDTGGADILCGGSGQVACPVINGQAWTMMNYGGGENIFSLGARGTFAQQASGTVDILALLHWMQANNFMGLNAAISLVVFGFEVCSTNGGPETFTVSNYNLKASTPAIPAP